MLNRTNDTISKVTVIMNNGSRKKWKNKKKDRQYRWFTLDENSELLSYYTSRKNMINGERHGSIRLTRAIIDADEENDTLFTITADSKTHYFQVRDKNDREIWISYLKDIIFRLSLGYKRRCLLWMDGSVYSLLDVRSLLIINKFDKKLAEADSYLQILTEQSKLLGETLIRIGPEEITQGNIIWTQAKKMLEQMKQIIVLLQIAKNTAYPVNRTVKPELSLLPNQNEFPLEVKPKPSQVSLEEDYQDLYDSNKASSQSPSLSHKISNFGDQDFPENSGISLPFKIAPSCIKADGTVDYDQLYENNSDEFNISIESEGSIVSHLLSQVKLGMDLTKVVLPTFILEKRSLLEMYADYFAHPDMFVQIADEMTEQNRMVQVVKWYLCAYHAGRKSTIARKPYNPILGEFFQCYWNLQEESVNDGKLITDGPVPWCHGNHLTFVAEQVSHHPPISAFYAEHYNKRISFNAHVWTKSKFLGLSIGVYNIGSGIIDVIDRNEQYVVTFPNGYGRSILTVPWIELGGTVNIVCEKTGHKAEIEFLTKPFYGGKKHRITGEIFGPTDKKAFLSINGEWNGMIEARWADGRTQQFANIKDLKITSKIVRPIDSQEENESRKLWKEVTAGLWMNDLTQASNAKYALEQKQRLEEQERKCFNRSWETKLFRLDNYKHWVYVKPLARRLNHNAAANQY